MMMMTLCTNCWRALCRRKLADRPSGSDSEPGPLARVLGAWDLTALGVGSTLGVGVYVLAGNVSRNIAGPAVVLSFLLAAIASVFAGLCYAEFGARVPRAGSAYIYSYVCVGEFIAFTIGWNLILEYVIGSASVARGLSMYLDSMLNNSMKDAFRHVTPMAVPYLSSYFDFFAFSASLLLAGALAFGVKESSILNNMFTTVNLGVVLFVILAGSFESDAKNWNIAKEDIPEGVNGGDGGFLPFGFVGVVKGAATCFYGFVGFDCIATTGEEVKNPQKVIPIAIMVSLTIIFFSYFGVSAVLTLMWPYYAQDVNAPIPYVFEQIGWPWAKWTVAVGGVFGLCASLFGAMFPLPRIIYAMATDGLLFSSLGIVNARFKTPLVGTILSGLLTGIMAAMFELVHLVEMMSIGTLIAYTIVAACVLLLRYEAQHYQDPHTYSLLPLQGKDDSSAEDELAEYTDSPSEEFHFISPDCVESTRLMAFHEKVTVRSVYRQLFNMQRLKQPSSLSAYIVTVEVVLFCILCLSLGLSTMYMGSSLADGKPWAVAVVVMLVLLMCGVLLSMSMQPNSARTLAFKVPLVPLVPALSIFMNLYLILMLSEDTWVRFGIWMAVGYLIYFLYGVHTSKGVYVRECLVLKKPSVEIVIQDPSPEQSRMDIMSESVGPSSNECMLHSDSGSEVEEIGKSASVMEGHPILLKEVSQEEMKTQDLNRTNIELGKENGNRGPSIEEAVMKRNNENSVPTVDPFVYNTNPEIQSQSRGTEKEMVIGTEKVDNQGNEREMLRGTDKLVTGTGHKVVSDIGIGKNALKTVPTSGLEVKSAISSETVLSLSERISGTELETVFKLRSRPGAAADGKLITASNVQQSVGNITQPSVVSSKVPAMTGDSSWINRKFPLRSVEAASKLDKNRTEIQKSVLGRGDPKPQQAQKTIIKNPKLVLQISKPILQEEKAALPVLQKNISKKEESKPFFRTNVAMPMSKSSKPKSTPASPQPSDMLRRRSSLIGGAEFASKLSEVLLGNLNAHNPMINRRPISQPVVSGESFSVRPKSLPQSPSADTEMADSEDTTLEKEDIKKILENMLITRENKPPVKSQPLKPPSTPPPSLLLTSFISQETPLQSSVSSVSVPPPPPPPPPPPQQSLTTTENFEQNRQHRLLMGNVLASIKFLHKRSGEKSDSESEGGSNSLPEVNYNEDDDSEVFELPDNPAHNSKTAALALSPDTLILTVA